MREVKDQLGSVAVRPLIAACLLFVGTVGPVSACGVPDGKKPVLPPPGASIDGALNGSKVTEKDVSRVRALQAQILGPLGKDEARARKLEERAMTILGYEKVWTRCGSGPFRWVTRKG